MLDEKKNSGKAVVVGAGTMGGGIAAQLANAGWEVSLIDIDDSLAQAGLSRIKASKPPLLYLHDFANRITTGNTADNLEWLKDAAWIVEAVAEKLDIKRSILALIDAHAGSETVVTSNTSGLSLREMADGRSSSFKQRFFGTHFCNPPRYLKLLELIPLPETDPELAAGYARFAEQVLGQRAVFARDTPGFISTRIGIWHLLDCIRTAQGMGITPEEGDYLTGPLIGRPRSATFRLADLVGFDILSDIGRNQYSRLLSDPFRDGWLLPDLLNRLIPEGRTGDKSGAGFYRRAGGETLVLDTSTMQYRPRRGTHIEAVEALQKIPLPDRIRVIKAERRERWGKYLNTVLDRLDEYVRAIGPAIAEDAVAIDHVMQWGFNWQMPPCQMADLRRDPAAAVPSYYCGAGLGRKYRDFAKAEMLPIPSDPQYISLSDLKQAGRTIRETDVASLVDLGDGIVCLEFHTKMNTLSPPVSAFIDEARVVAERDFQALVIGNQAQHFSAGYDLSLFLDAMTAKKWGAIDKMLKGLQDAALGLKYAKVPVVSAPHGYTLGGGTELTLHCQAVQAVPELYMGLPEVTVGVVPAGGGTKEMLARALREWDRAEDAYQYVEYAFDVIASAARSGSGEEARRLGYLREADSVSRNADRQLFEAKQRALQMAKAGYQPPARESLWVLGEDGLARLRMKIHWQFRAGAITEHDRKILDGLATILSGGHLTHAQEVSEEELLALEREVFIKLAHEPKSQERMRRVLDTGKPLRN
jgi:3-hydroxyacyl-CoA dehydrogenase